MSFSRRQFISGASVATATAALHGPFSPRARAGQTESPEPRKPLPKVKIGKTGLETTLLGVGTGTHGGTDFLNLGQETFVELLLHAFRNGIRYIDTAENYRTHIFTRFALQAAKRIGIEREDFFLLTKSFARTPGAAKVIVDRYRYEMECGYLDALLMHCLTEGDWPKKYADVFDVLLQERKNGRVKSIGVSVHTLEALEACLEVGELDVLLVRINPFGVNMDATPEKVVPIVKRLHDRGVGILGMKIYGEGKFQDRQQRYDSLKYVMELGCVDAMTIGFTEKSHIDETLDAVSSIRSETV